MALNRAGHPVWPNGWWTPLACGEKVRLVITGSESIQFALRGRPGLHGPRPLPAFRRGLARRERFGAARGAGRWIPAMYPTTSAGRRRHSTEAGPADMLAAPFNDVERATEIVERHHGETCRDRHRAPPAVHPAPSGLLCKAMRALCDAVRHRPHLRRDRHGFPACPGAEPRNALRRDRRTWPYLWQDDQRRLSPGRHVRHGRT